MNRKRTNKERDITLMTVLAYEATAESQALLKKYGRETGKGYQDLEVKLANLYFDTDDKVQLEKELAEIHPHKKWIFEHITPIKKLEKGINNFENELDKSLCNEIDELKKQLDFQIESKKLLDFKNEMKEALKDEFNKVEMKSGFQGSLSGNSNYSQCQTCNRNMSNFSGIVDRNEKETKNDIFPYIGVIGVFAIVGLTFIAIQKIK